MEFGELYEKYFKDVYLFILTISKNSDVAEEITQATFFKALNPLNEISSSLKRPSPIKYNKKITSNIIQNTSN